MKDKRKFPRFEWNKEGRATFHSPATNGTVIGWIMDQSLEGLGVLFDDPYEVGDKLVLNYEDIKISFEVVYCNEVSLQSIVYRCGLKATDNKMLADLMDESV